MVGDAAAGCADDRRELGDRTRPAEQDLQQVQPGWIPEHTKVPRPGGEGGTRRRDGTVTLG